VLILNGFKSRDFASADFEGVSSTVCVSADSRELNGKVQIGGCGRVVGCGKSGAGFFGCASREKSQGHDLQEKESRDATLRMTAREIGQGFGADFNANMRYVTLLLNTNQYLFT
jgi:hypothetical protein